MSAIPRTSVYTSCLNGENCQVFDHVRPKNEPKKFDEFLRDPLDLKRELALINEGRTTPSSSSSLASSKKRI
ncbi:MAG: hypothetical protein A3I05_05945 [Deltaproteobacteria bacterium RIFCSPLOWO2_02_FULL_44_10]|nr:MAG: hypothetical protein A3C46_04765 [Deltaproteobacteria bacterium RIFCSPHIGHO2_02_FULL_44_16]OGQ46145.1 MAG: hypothetical protein A3I05_05945 [Deltaproteobacteria bacterium RIFCSPLOWO2_02_FULL_44_10]